MARKQVRAYSRADVMHSLLMVRPALGKGVFVPILSHFCFNGESVCAYDDSIGISVPMHTTFSCAVPGELMLKLLGTMVADDMDIGLVDNALQVTCGRSAVKLPMLPSSAFLFNVDALKGKNVLGEVPVDSALVEGMMACLLAVGNDPTHPAQMGVTMRNDGQGLCLYSTDNVTMSEFIVDSDTEETFLPQGGVIMPTEFCRQLIALQGNIGSDGVMTVNEDSVVVRFAGAADVVLFGKLIAVEKALDFPGVFDRMIPVSKSKALQVPASWDAAFTRAAAVVNPAHPISAVSFEEGVITVESKSPIGEVVDSLEVDATAMPKCKPFGIDPQHVIRASKICSLMNFQPKALVLQDASKRFTHLISHCVE